jgi:DNA-binding MarR family transcriptional regulator
VIVFAVNSSNEVQVQKIGHLPPSAKLVYTILKANRQMTQKDIIRESYLPERTVRYALSRLKEENVLTEYLSLADARQSLYRLAVREQEPALAF